MSFINARCHGRVARKEEGNKGRRFPERFCKTRPLKESSGTEKGERGKVEKN